MYDTINKGGNYTKKVRRLGEFHPELGNALEYDGQDIDDPLYGNEGGDTERVGSQWPVMACNTHEVNEKKHSLMHC